NNCICSSCSSRSGSWLRILEKSSVASSGEGESLAGLRVGRGTTALEEEDFRLFVDTFLERGITGSGAAGRARGGGPKAKDPASALRALRAMPMPAAAHVLFLPVFALPAALRAPCAKCRM